MLKQLEQWCKRPSLRGLMLIEHRWLERQLLGLRDRIDELGIGATLEQIRQLLSEEGKSEWCGYQLVGEGATGGFDPTRRMRKKLFTVGEGCFMSSTCPRITFKPSLPLSPARVDFIVVTGPCKLTSVRIGLDEVIGTGDCRGGMGWALIGSVIEVGVMFEVTLERAQRPVSCR